MGPMGVLGAVAKVRTAVGRRCLVGTQRLENHWGRAEATGSTDRHAHRGGGGVTKHTSARTPGHAFI